LPVGANSFSNTFGRKIGISFIDLLGLIKQLSYTTVSGGPNSQSWSVKWNLRRRPIRSGLSGSCRRRTLANSASIPSAKPSSRPCRPPSTRSGCRWMQGRAIVGWGSARMDIWIWR
jgi:hypothetical protein